MNTCWKSAEISKPCCFVTKTWCLTCKGSWNFFSRNASNGCIVHMWCITWFGSHYLAFAWSFERMRMHANVFSTFMSFLSVCMTLHGIWTAQSHLKRLNTIQKGKHLQSNDVWMLLHDFIVSWELQCNVILHCITSCTLEHLFAVQFNVFISLLWFLFIVYYLFLVMQLIMNTVSLLKV